MASHHFAATRYAVAFGGEVDMNRQGKPGGLVQNDPERTFLLLGNQGFCELSATYTAPSTML